jgi:hypothetical protein
LTTFSRRGGPTRSKAGQPWEERSALGADADVNGRAGGDRPRVVCGLDRERVTLGGGFPPTERVGGGYVFSELHPAVGPEELDLLDAAIAVARDCSDRDASVPGERRALRRPLDEDRRR